MKLFFDIFISSFEPDTHSLWIYSNLFKMSH